MKLRSYAKINLTLDIIGKRSDWYHELETVLQQINLYDEIELREISKDIIKIKCNIKDLESAENTVYKAAKLIKEKCKIKKGIEIIIDKKIPIGAGLSGGSSNAAAVLKGLNFLWKLNLSKKELMEISKEIGMDTPFHIIGGTCMGTGRGELLEKMEDLKKYFVIVIYPGFQISTKCAYSNLVYEKTGKEKSTMNFIKNNNLTYLHNDIKYSLLKEYGKLEKIKKDLGKNSSISGTGSCVFGLYNKKEEAKELYKMLKTKYKHIFFTTTLNKRIELAKTRGFCFGVKRALEEVDKLDKTKKISIFGNLIHNPEVIKKLKRQGISITERIEDIKRGIVVISAHGTPDKNIAMIKSRKLDILDLTCPFVKKVHIKTKDAEKMGRKVIVYGDKSHTEVKGIIGNLKNYKVIKDIKDLSSEDINCKVTLVSQTTREAGEFEKLIKKAKSKIKDIEIEDTICFATKDRQKSAIDLAKKSDIVIVIGGKMSSNTLQLKEICSKICETKHIENEKELRSEWLFDKTKIGITAGASTPEDIIERVRKNIENLL